jgi:hypothetical protein
MGANTFVVRGEEGWLFYRGELDYVLFPWNHNAKKLRALDVYAKAHATTLIIIPLPEKIDLYPEMLSSKLGRFDYLDSKYTAFFNRLKRDDVKVLELKSKLLPLKDEFELFEHDETHLVSAGLKVVVEETVKEFFDSAQLDSSCLATKKIKFSGILSQKLNHADTGRMVDIFFNSCICSSEADSNKILIIGDSYANYLRNEQGSFGNLLGAYLPSHHFQYYGKINRGFAQAQNIVHHIQKNPGTTIIWLFSNREFYKPLQFSLNTEQS